MDEHGTPGEREFETGKDEAWFTKIMELHSTWLANMKRTYDEYQQVSLETIKRTSLHFDKLISDAQGHDNARQTIAEQALQNAVETANMVGKQAVRHGDVAIDGHWNPVQQGAADTLTARAVTIDDASLKAIGAVVAVAVAEALGGKKTA